MTTYQSAEVALRKYPFILQSSRFTACLLLFCRKLRKLRFPPSVYAALIISVSCAETTRTFPPIIADYKYRTLSGKTGCPDWLDTTGYANRFHRKHISSLSALEEICWVAYMITYRDSLYARLSLEQVKSNKKNSVDDKNALLWN